MAKAPTYDCSSIAYFKMVDNERQLCFPDSYQLGLDVLVRVEGQRSHPLRTSPLRTQEPGYLAAPNTVQRDLEVWRYGYPLAA